MTKFLLGRGFIALGLSLILGNAALAAAKKLKVTEASAKFHALGKPGFMRIIGEGAKPIGTLTLDDKKNVTGEFRCSLTPFRTGIDLRDKLMAEQCLELVKFPEARLELKEYVLQPGEQPFKAILYLHGASHEVSGSVEASPQEGKWNVEVKFKINVKDYKIDIPSYAGITVGDNVDIHVAFAAEEQK